MQDVHVDVQVFKKLYRIVGGPYYLTGGRHQHLKSTGPPKQKAQNNIRIMIISSSSSSSSSCIAPNPRENPSTPPCTTRPYFFQTPPTKTSHPPTGFQQTASRCNAVTTRSSSSVVTKVSIPWVAPRFLHNLPLASMDSSGSGPPRKTKMTMENPPI